ncbi:MAG: sensor histidine kinase [Bryobacteraceae bacterium]
MLPHLWRIALRTARLILTAGCAAMYAVSIKNFDAVLAILIAFAIFGVVSYFTRRFDSGWGAAAGLIVDTGLFVVWSLAGPPAAGWWISAVLYAYALANAVLVHDLIRVLIVFGVCTLLVFLPAPKQPAPWHVVLAAGLVACMGAVQKRHLEDRVSQSARQAVLFRSEAQGAREAERQRIAADFHDGPLQSFISFQMRLEIVKKLMTRDLDAAKNELETLQTLCKMQVGELRGFVRSMRPVEEGVSLSASISRMVEHFQRDSGIVASFSSGEFGDPPDPEISLELIQIVREALNNVQKHSGSTRAAVSMSKIAEKLEVSVEDNGRGFAFSGAYTLDELELLRLGPVSIKRRVRLLGGEMSLESRPSEGTTLMLRIPA